MVTPDAWTGARSALSARLADLMAAGDPAAKREARDAAMAVLDDLHDTVGAR